MTNYKQNINTTYVPSWEPCQASCCQPESRLPETSRWWRCAMREASRRMSLWRHCFCGPEAISQKPRSESLVGCRN